MTQQLYARLAEAADDGKNLQPDDLSDGLASTDAHEVWMAVKASGVHRVSKAIDKIFDLALRSDWPEDVDVASISAWSLGKIGGDKIYRRARRLATSPAIGERRFAADLLGQLKTPNSIFLLEQLAQDPSFEVVSWAALSLSKYGDAALDTLKRLAESTPETDRVLLFADAMNKIGTTCANVALDDLLGSLNQTTSDSIKRLLSELEA